MYLLQGKLIAKAGHSKELANILLQASKLVAEVNGCQLYVIGKDSNDNNAVFVTEIWDSKEDHDNSLNDQNVKELIMKAIPILDGQPRKLQELEILGGIGI